MLVCISQLNLDATHSLIEQTSKPQTTKLPLRSSLFPLNRKGFTHILPCTLINSFFPSKRFRSILLACHSPFLFWLVGPFVLFLRKRAIRVLFASLSTPLSLICFIYLLLRLLVPCCLDCFRPFRRFRSRLFVQPFCFLPLPAFSCLLCPLLPPPSPFSRMSTTFLALERTNGSGRVLGRPLRRRLSRTLTRRMVCGTTRRSRTAMC